MVLASGWARRTVAFVRLGRPHFLVGGLVMHSLGVAAALYAGARLSLAAFLWGQIAVTATQLMVHYANDYYDLAVDRANTTATLWSGGSRILPDGALSPRVALVAALALALLAVTAACVLTFVVGTGPLTLPWIGLTLFLAWGYSAPPFQWHSRGVGEAVTALIVPGLTPLLGFYLQAGHIARWLLLALAPLVCIQVAVQLSVEFPDVAGDAATGKRTLPVRLGAGAARLYLAALACAYGLLPLLLWAGVPGRVVGAMALPVPLAVWLAWRLASGAWAHPARWGRQAFATIALLIFTAGLQLLAFLSLAHLPGVPI